MMLDCHFLSPSCNVREVLPELSEHILNFDILNCQGANYEAIFNLGSSLPRSLWLKEGTDVQHAGDDLLELSG